MTEPTSPSIEPKRPNIVQIAAGGVVVIALGALLLLDLFQQGLVWRALYNITGEESPPAQIVATNEWIGRWFRPQPQTATYTPVEHAGVNPFGINVFLEQEVEIEKREQIVRMASEAGFVWLRQEFPWEDIEIHGPGDFEDRRNDRDGDGEITEADIVSAWDKYDNIVDIVDEYDMRLMVRLSNPPDWTHANEDSGDKGPPDNLEDYINFVVVVAERYQGRIHHYQIWNEPNIFPEWGNRDVNAADYVEMLCESYAALKAIDPEIVVITGPIAPTVSMTYRDLHDFIYLQLMFDAGAADCFDVLSMQGYGLNSGPTDRRLRPTTINFNRVLYVRDLLVSYGHPDKAIWISEAAWNPVPNDPNISNREQFGVVTEEQAARYMVQAYQRQQQEWPYTGVMFYWFFKRASDAEQNQSWYYFRMTEPDFTPLPVYDAMVDYTSSMTPTLYKGVHQADHWAINHGDDAEVVEADGAEFGEAIDTQRVDFTVRGTVLRVRWQSDGELQLEADGQTRVLDSATDADGWQTTQVRLGWLPQTQSFTLTSGEAFNLDSITVYDNTTRNAVILGVGVLIGVISGVWAAIRRRRLN